VKKTKKAVKICLICSHGGHFVELKNAIKGIEGDFYWVTYKTTHTEKELTDKKHYFIIDPHITKWKYIFNGIQSVLHLFFERPNVIISTGAGIAIPTLIIGKYLCNAKIIYIESIASVTSPSKTGKFTYYLTDLFLIQWPELISFFPNAKYVGIL
jgi:beta-1,4-N-acetylglucosaminyltransferase